MAEKAKTTVSKNKKGLYQGREYKSWNAMKQRCTNPNNPEYKNYGGRGIKYDKKWETFGGFFEDMGVRPENTTLDRIDVDKDYNKTNCRWATKEQQQRNQRIHKNPEVGITYDENHKTCKWVAGISYKNKRHANRFKTKNEAINWRKRKERELWEIL